MKKIKIWSILMLAMITLSIMVACTGDDEGDSGVTTEYVDGLYYDGMLYYKITKSNPAEVSLCKADESVVTVEIPAYVNIDGKRYTCTSIAEDVFRGCSGLTSVTIPNCVETLGSYAFSMCEGLTTITIPNSVTSIGDGTFGGCSGLTSVSLGNSLTSIGEFAFSGCSGLTSLTIGNGVTSIGELAFSHCSGLTSLTIGNSLTNIGNSAFSECSGLTSINVEAGNAKYDSRENCNGIIETATNTLIVGCKSTSIPNSVTCIGENAFAGCASLPSITIPNSVTVIGDGAFNGCLGLNSVTIPNSVTNIGNNAFYGCSSLASVTIPNSVTSIGRNAFSSCIGLTSINVEAGNAKYDSRENCNGIIETATNTLIFGCPQTSIPSSVTSIGEHAFSYCSVLTSIAIPNSVTNIGEFAFYCCYRLTSVTIPNSVMSIERYAFYCCYRLTSVTIGNSVTSFGEFSFQYCTGLTSVRCLAQTPPRYNSSYEYYGSSLFDASIYDTATLYIPTGTLDAYKKADGWKNFKNIVEE